MSRTTMVLDAEYLPEPCDVATREAERAAFGAERMPAGRGDFSLATWCNGVDVDWWSTFEEDMLALSRRYPDWLFTVYAEGEASDDLWYQHFCNGRTQTRYVEFVFPDIDMDYLTGKKEELSCS